MLDAAFGLNGSVGLLFKKQIEVSYYDSNSKELFVLGHSNEIKSLPHLLSDNVPSPLGTC